MTQVSFHFNVPDRMAYACRLLRKAVRRGARVVVAGPGDTLGRLDKQLWIFDPIDFVPHLHARAGHEVTARLRDTPVWLVEQVHEAPHRDVLLNLGDALVDGYEGFGRVIELVSLDGDDRQAGRRRWKQYSDRGDTIEKHDVAEEARA